MLWRIKRHHVGTLATKIYQTNKKDRNDRLSQALSLLDKKAASDPEIAEALRLLRPWAPGQAQDNETMSNDN
jgi:hypothetical protein